MTKRVVLSRHGGTEVMEFDDTPLPPPGAGEARIRHTAIGVNFIDIYHRSGLYPLELPAGLGMEAVGIVEAIGPGVSGLTPGERVGYVSPPTGAYAQARNYPAERLVALPPSVDDDIAAAGLLKGITAWYLLRRTRRVLGDDAILVYAAAGGVGQLLVQFASHLGATVYGVVGSEEKAEQARADGCAEVLLAHQNIAAAVRDLGGVDVVYDAVGADTFEQSLDCLRPLGMLVSYGNASGEPPPISPLELARRGSLFLTRPSLMDYVRNHDDLQHAAHEVCDLLGREVMRPRVGQSWPLEEVAAAHQALESRQTRGATLLRP